MSLIILSIIKFHRYTAIALRRNLLTDYINPMISLAPNFSGIVSQPRRRSPFEHSTRRCKAFLTLNS